MVNSQDEMAGNSVSGLNWSGFDELRLNDEANSVIVTVGSSDKWDKAHLRRLRQSADLPGLVPVIDSDFASDGKPFAVTPVVDSPTLSDRIPPSGSEWEDCAAITEAAARATHEAHLRGLFHGSLAPGLIHVIGDDVAVNGIGLGLGGTPSPDYAHWIAPEVMDGGDATERSDVYSLGKILEASLGSSLEDVPRSVRRLIMWSSSDTPEARPPSALEFASILAEALGEERKTYSPAFIPTADTNDLASTASGEVAAFVPSEGSSGSIGGAATAAGVGAAAVGAAALAGTVLGNDDDTDQDPAADAAADVDADAPDGADEVASALPGDSEDVDNVDDIDPQVLSDAVTTGEIPTDEVATTTGELTEEDLAAAESAAGDPVFDSREYSEGLLNADGDDDYEVPAAAQTIDLDEVFEPERKGNKAGIIVGALLAVGLGIIAFQFLNSDDGDDVASDATSESQDAEEEVESPSVSEDDPTEVEAEDQDPDPVAEEDEPEQVTTTTEAPITTTTTTEPTTTSTEATSTTTEPPEVEEAAPAVSPSGPISKDDAGVQVLHGIPGVEADVYVNGEALAPGFTAKTIAGPANLPAGDYEVTIYAATDGAPANASDRSDDPLISQTVTVGDDPTTLVAHLDGEGNPTLSAFVDNLANTEPASGRVEVRHLAAAPAVQLSVDGEAVAGLLEPGKSATLELSAGEHTIEAATADGTPVISAPLTLGDGQFAGVSVIGAADGGSLDIAVQVYSGLASAPAAVPTGDSDLLGSSQDPTGLYLLAGLTSLMALAGGLVIMRRNRRVL